MGTYDLKTPDMQLVLENGSQFIGHGFGEKISGPSTLGELVFHTGMTGYQEIYSDPSYCDQIVVLTYPLIGNYGVSKASFESLVPSARGLVVRELTPYPSHHAMIQTLSKSLANFKIPAISGVDTRMITKIIRNQGEMKAVLAPLTSSKEEIMAVLKQPLPQNHVEKVSTKIPHHYPGPGPRIILYDFGCKKNILKNLLSRGCDVITVPYDMPFEGLAEFYPDGILLSNGPGDPSVLKSILPTIKKCAEHFPLFSICLGHQLLALAYGGKTQKMKFGHHGSNHSVKDLLTGKCFMTSQNHGYEVAADSLGKTPFVLTHINLNDETCEGFRHPTRPVFSVQFHPEANPGPDDTQFLFDEFVQACKNFAHRGSHA